MSYYVISQYSGQQCLEESCNVTKSNFAVCVWSICELSLLDNLLQNVEFVIWRFEQKRLKRLCSSEIVLTCADTRWRVHVEELTSFNHLLKVLQENSSLWCFTDNLNQLNHGAASSCWCLKDEIWKTTTAKMKKRERKKNKSVNMSFLLCWLSFILIPCSFSFVLNSIYLSMYYYALQKGEKNTEIHVWMKKCVLEIRKHLFFTSHLVHLMAFQFIIIHI